jgi:NADPH2:quinone reductase
VKERGKDARQFNIGDEVYFAHGGIGKQPGNYAEYSVVEERFAARKPRSVSFAEAAAAPSSCITAWETLFYHGRLQKNQKVLIHAGAGGVGHIAVQLARVNGAKICTTVSSEEKARFVRELGAEKVIMYQEKDFVKETLEWTEGEGVDLVVDLVGKDTFFRTFTATCCYGNIIALLGPDPDYADWKEARLRNLQISYYLMLTPIYYELLDHQFRQTTILQRCSQLLEENELKIHVTKTFPLKEAKEAHHTIEKGDTMGKIVLIPDS